MKGRLSVVTVKLCAAMWIVLPLAALLGLTAPAQAQWSVRTVDDNGSAVNSIDDAEALLASRPTAGSATPGTINYSANFPGVSGDDFAFEAVGRVDVLSGTSGTFTLYVNSDDGFRLRRNGTVIGEFTAPTGASNTTMSNITLNDGDVLRLTYFERGGEHLTFRVNDNSGALVGDSGSGIGIASVQNRIVTKTADTNDGTCDSDCSLREAIAAAQAGDTIQFASPLFDTAQEIQINGQLVIDKLLSITGKGANLTTIRNVAAQGNNSRVFWVNGNVNGGTISGLTITGGNTTTGSGGGGIRLNFSSTLTLRGVHVTGNFSGVLTGYL